MNIYIVTTEVYERHAQGEIKTRLIKAKNLNDLAVKLNPDLAGPSEEASTPWLSLCIGNGDGADYHIVYELNGDKLREVEMTGEEVSV